MSEPATAVRCPVVAGQVIACGGGDRFEDAPACVRHQGRVLLGATTDPVSRAFLSNRIEMSLAPCYLFTSARAGAPAA